jgi:hypothetical protein
MLESQPRPGRNVREWGCPVCGLVARAQATPDDGYLLWHVRHRGPASPGVMIPVAETPPAPPGGTGVTAARFDGRPGLALNPGWPPGRKCWP